MLKPIITSYKLTTCRYLYLRNTHNTKRILLTIKSIKENYLGFTRRHFSEDVQKALKKIPRK